MKCIQDPTISTWFSQVEKIKTCLGLKYSIFSKTDTIGQLIKRQIKSKFEQFWLHEVNKTKLGKDNKNHNKLRFYATLKGCFKKEPYIDLVPNRSQRADLTRIRISSSHLGIEKLRYKKPTIPEDQRYCNYCTPSGVDNDLPGYVDSEHHFLVSCNSFTLKRNCLFGRLNSIIPGFLSLTPVQQTATLLCPTKVVTAKLVNKYIRLLFNTRKLLDDGVAALNGGYASGVIILNEFYDDSDDDMTEN